MNVSPLVPILGNLCVALAVGVALLPLRRLLSDYANRHLNDDRWVNPALFVLVPLWLLLMGALICMTAAGGFDWLRLARGALYPLAVAASGALAAVTLVFVGLYMRPGFTPRFLYVPMIYGLPLATGLLVILGLNRKFVPGVPIQWLAWPWTVFAALSVIGSAAFLGPRLVRAGLGGLAGVVHRFLNTLDATPDQLAKIAALDPQRDFHELLNRARAVHGRGVREAATARLRTNPEFLGKLAAALESRSPSTALEFLHGATLSPAEQARLALPARTALDGFLNDIPAPNYIPRERQKELLRWGRKHLPVIIGQFSGTGVDFSQVMPAFEHALRPDDTLR